MKLALKVEYTFSRCKNGGRSLWVVCQMHGREMKQGAVVTHDRASEMKPRVIRRVVILQLCSCFPVMIIFSKYIHMLGLLHYT